MRGETGARVSSNQSEQMDDRYNTKVAGTSTNHEMRETIREEGRRHELKQQMPRKESADNSGNQPCNDTGPLCVDSEPEQNVHAGKEGASTGNNFVALQNCEEEYEDNNKEMPKVD